MNPTHLLGGMAFAVLVVALFINSKNYKQRQSKLVAFYRVRRILYRDWLALYGEEAKPKIKSFLRCFGESFFVPHEIIHKLGPDDGIMDFYNRDYLPGEPDSLEANRFVRELKDSFGYTTTEEDGSLTMSQLFEKATGLKRK